MADHSPRTARMPSEAMRSCIRTGCRWPAAATLSYRYATAEVWLSELGDEHPSTHDLCPHHADSLRVPRGWTLVDDRCPAEAVHEPSAAELAQRVTRLRSSVDAILEQPVSPVRSRYADLLDNLPTHPGPDGDAPDPSTAEGQQDDPRTAELAPVGVSHELAPIVRDLATARRASPAARPHTDHAADRSQPTGRDIDVTGPVGTVDPAGPAGAGPAGADPAAADPAAADPAAAGPAGADPAAAAAGPDGGAPPGPDPDAVHPTGIRGAIVVQLPLRVEGAEDA